MQKKPTPEQARRQAISHQKWVEKDPKHALKVKAEASARWRSRNPEQARASTRESMRALRAAKSTKEMK